MNVFVEDSDVGVWVLLTCIWAFKRIHSVIIEFKASRETQITLTNPAEFDAILDHIYHFEGIFFRQVSLDEPKERDIPEPLLLQLDKFDKGQFLSLSDSDFKRNFVVV